MYFWQNLPTYHTVTRPTSTFCWRGGQRSVPNFEKEVEGGEGGEGGGVRKKMSAWGDLSSSRHGYLSGGLLCFLSKKRLLKIKYGFESSISNVDLGQC